MLKSLRWVLALLGGVGVAAALAVALQGHHFIGQLDESAHRSFVAKDVVADILPPPMYLIEMRLVLAMMLDGSLPANDGRKRFEELAQEYDARVQYWKQNPPFGLEKQLLGEQHVAGMSFMQAARSQIVEPVVAGQLDKAKANMPAVHALYQKHRAGVDATVVEGNAMSSQMTRAFDETHGVSKIAMLLTALAAVASVLVVYRVVVKSIQKPVHISMEMATLIAQGDLAARVEPDAGRTDSLGRLQDSLQSMRSDLNETVSSVLTIAQGVSTASTEIAQGNQDLSARTESQASALQQTAASMEELTAAVNQNAQSSRQANELSKKAAQVAQSGSEAVSQVVDTMRGMNASSAQIAGIVSVIESIAFQTNILALNAAVEAARAGDQGRGFAVVASEVRSLASRSAQAAKEIKGLIDASVRSVAEGSALADNAGSRMADMLQAAQKLNDILAEIESTSRSQSDGISQVNEAVARMDQVTQQNAALVEEMAAAANSLSVQSQDLVRQVGHFKVRDQA
jgi:methyl-accepting chemotaxis protein-1 (serine sensor receptor)